MSRVEIGFRRELTLRDSSNSTSGAKSGFVELMAELLSNPRTRERFFADSADVLYDFDLTDEEAKTICSVNQELLEQQAELLINKRWCEVKKRIPNTIAPICEHALELFQFYASRTWPEGYLRHVVDAVGFAEFLYANQVTKLDRSEIRRLRRILAKQR